LARQELCSDKGLHGNLLAIDAISGTLVSSALISAGGDRRMRRCNALLRMCVAQFCGVLIL
jgi:hypothetical protein